MNKKVFIGVGHGGVDPGAVANGLKEKDINLVMALACNEELKRHGVVTGMSRTKDENDPVGESVKESNLFNPDLTVEFHTNAGGGDGAEFFYYQGSPESLELAKNIEEEVKKFGQNSRGCKRGNHLSFVSKTEAPACLIECAFIDNKNDIAIVDEVHEQKEFGKSVAKGILKSLGIAYKEEIKEKAQEDGVFYRVVSGSYSDKKNAQEQIEKLKEKGIDSFIAAYKK